MDLNASQKANKKPTRILASTSVQNSLDDPITAKKNLTVSVLDQKWKEKQYIHSCQEA